MRPRRPPALRRRPVPPWALAGLAALLAGGCGGGGSASNLCPGLSTAGAGGAFTVTGTVEYEDRPLDTDGFTGASAYLPVREAAVQAVRCSDGAVLKEGKTDGTGAFSLSASNAGTAGIYVRVLTRALSALYDVTVTDQTSSPVAVYAVRSVGFDERSAPVVTLTATAAAGIAPPFNILDQALTAIEFVDAAVPLVAGQLAALRMVWEADTTSTTAYFPTSTTIYVLDQPNAPGFLQDTDGYDDPVIRHEVGHYLVDQLSKDDSPGGAHAAGEEDQDARLAWSEGWGNFFAGASGDSPNYVDTYDPNPPGGMTSALYFSLEDLSPTYAGTSGSTAELAVAATLWDGLDGSVGGPTDNDGDPAALTSAQVITAIERLAGGPSPVDFARFWNTMRADTATFLAGDLTGFRNAAALLGIDLQEDAGTDDTAGGATALAGGFPRTADANLAWDVTKASSDTDYYTTDLTGGTTYTIFTSDLGDGADTYLEVRDAADATALKSNDNWDGTFYSAVCGALGAPACPPNDVATLASQLTFDPDVDGSGTGTYLIRVTRSPNAPPSAGLFGGYHLEIQ